MKLYKLTLEDREIEEILINLKDKSMQYKKQIEETNDREELENCIEKSLKLKYLIGKIENAEEQGDGRTEREKELEERLERLQDIIQGKF